MIAALGLGCVRLSRIHVSPGWAGLPLTGGPFQVIGAGLRFQGAAAWMRCQTLAIAAAPVPSGVDAQASITGTLGDTSRDPQDLVAEGAYLTLGLPRGVDESGQLGSGKQIR